MVLSTVELYGLNGSCCAKSVISCGVSCAKDWDLVESEVKLKKDNSEITGYLSNNVLFISASSLRYS